MSRFLENAQAIFEAAENSAAAGNESEEYTILLKSPTGGIHMIANSDWSLPALQEAHGAHTAYRVSRSGDRVMVDGNNGQRTCHLEATTAAQKAHFLLNATPAWQGYANYPALLAA